jgi:Cu-processing system ATP-binding protein
MGTSALSIQGVSKAFGKHLAVKEISLDVEAGECLALVGHNGAGKTTLFKVILGLLRPSEGSITLGGFAPGDRRINLGFLPENVVFQKDLTGLEILSFFARLKGRRKENLPALLEQVGLKDVGRKRIGTYSKGMRQRLGLAQTLIGRPALLILDEPTSGLDPSSRRSFYELLDDLRQDGTTILLSSHALSEVESYTNRVGIMRHGQLLAHGPLHDLASAAGLPVRIEVLSDDVEKGQSVLDGFSGVTCDGSKKAGLLIVTCSAEDKLAVVRRMVNEGDCVKDIRIMPPTLDDIYEHYQNGDAQ